MDEQTKILMELNSRMIKIETNIEHISDRLGGLSKVSEKIDDVENTANEALSLTKENRSDIDEIKDNQKWTWRTIAGIGVTLIVYFITRIIET